MSFKVIVLKAGTKTTVMPEKLNIEKKKCPKCGSEFNCSTSSKCWCYEYDIPSENLDKLEAEYDSCLCPECLKFYTRATL